METKGKSINVKWVPDETTLDARLEDCRELAGELSSRLQALMTYPTRDPQFIMAAAKLSYILTLRLKFIKERKAEPIFLREPESYSDEELIEIGELEQFKESP